ncbi:hypothetical protein HN011_001700 [Eciton burchellii]|nr:hypothetical protein HN011_001700 [Eciton burchellii]
MARMIVITLLAILALLLPARAIDLSKSKNIQLEFADTDVVPKTALKGLTSDVYGNGFIGNLELGRRYSDETVFRRVVEFHNPSNAVASNTLTMSVNNGIIHYISVVNDNGSYAVVCGEPNSLGSSRSNINIRTFSNTKSYLTITVAAH